MSVKPYQKYKESGVEWIGKIPAHWSTAPFFSVATENRRSNRGMIENNLLSLSYGKIIKKNIDSNIGLLPESFETYQIVEPDDIILRLTDLQNDKRSLRTASVSERGIITSAYLSVCPTGIVPKFLAYALRDADLRKVFYSMGGGLRQSMKFVDMKRLAISIPPLDEQQTIVTYLDDELSEIDAFIAIQEELIELMSERRTATITRAVTRGLSPNTPMKYSGVPWLGDIPAHWDVRKIKSFVAIPITDGPHETPEILDDGIPFISAESVSSGSINFDKARGFISEEDNVRFSKKYFPRKNDIYMVKSGATTGTCAIVDTDNVFNIWSPLAAIRCDDKTYPRFVLHALRSMNFQESVRLFWNYGTQQNIGMQVIGNLPLPYPNFTEQAIISEYLDTECAEIDAAIADAREAIALSKERRSAVISAAITGKIDVRGLVAPATVDIEGASVGAA